MSLLSNQELREKLGGRQIGVMTKWQNQSRRAFDADDQGPAAVTFPSASYVIERVSIDS